MASTSDTNDTQKDNLNLIISPPELVIAQWNPANIADPSGMRQIITQLHPSFVRLVGEDAASGLVFTGAKQNSTSDTVAITIRANTTGKLIHNMKVWMSDDSAFTGIDGYEVSAVAESTWIPNIALPSGSGVLGRSFSDALSVLRSDLNPTISGIGNTDQSSSGEIGVDISQYVYMAFDSNSDFIPGAYGPAGFQLRISIEFQDA